MSENTILGCPPEFASEIENALKALRKQRYTAQVRDSGDTRSITFKLGESEQTLEFKNGEWGKEGVVQKAIIEHLNI